MDCTDNVIEWLCEICHGQTSWTATHFFKRHPGLWEWWSTDPRAIEWRKHRALKEAEEQRASWLYQAEQLEQRARELRSLVADPQPVEPPKMPQPPFVDDGFTTKG